MNKKLRDCFVPCFAMVLAMTTLLHAEEPADVAFDDTWANWDKRFERAFEDITPRKVPGRTMGIIVPNDIRHDLLPMSAFGYQTLAEERFETIVIFLPAPDHYDLDGLAIPDLDEMDTPLGRFVIDTSLVGNLLTKNMKIKIDNSLFMPVTPRLLEIQLAALKFVLKNKTPRLKILPIYVRFSDTNSQVKDYAPMIAEMLKDIELDRNIAFVLAANLSYLNFPEKSIQIDANAMNALRNLDVETLINIEETPDKSILAMGALLLKWLGADHGEVLAYAHSGQLILSKDKSLRQGYVSAAFSSNPAVPPKLSHFNREKMVDIFDELLRTDMVAMTRQTCASILDATAAKPPSLIHKQAGKKWPIYVTLYSPDGKVAGQAGTHVAKGPLEESIRQFAFSAVQQAKPALTKENFSTYVVDVSIPYGFISVERPEELVPALNGIIAYNGPKTSAMHPDGWRTYPDPHQMLSAICHGLGMRPWDYATRKAKIDSFRVLSFNEKEPFQDLGAASRKKRKTKTPADEETSDDFGGGDAVLPF